MKKLIQFTLLGILSICSNAFAQVSTSKWQSQPIVVDGEAADWTTNPRFFNAESKVQYEFRNDAQNLYLIIKSNDRATQVQLMRAGFAVRLKVKTSPPLKMSIVFPAIKKDEIPPVWKNQEGKPEILVDKSVSAPEASLTDSALLEGFQFTKGYITSANKAGNSICFARNRGNRELTLYELSIPFREIYGADFALENRSGTPVQLQVVINELSQNEMKRMNDRMQSGRGMGRQRDGMQGGGREMGGMRGGEMPEADDMQYEMRSASLMQRKSFNIDFKLSAAK